MTEYRPPANRLFFVRHLVYILPTWCVFMTFLHLLTLRDYGQALIDILSIVPAYYIGKSFEAYVRNKVITITDKQFFYRLYKKKDKACDLSTIKMVGRFPFSSLTISDGAGLDIKLKGYWLEVIEKLLTVLPKDSIVIKDLAGRDVSNMHKNERVPVCFSWLFSRNPLARLLGKYCLERCDQYNLETITYQQTPSPDNESLNMIIEEYGEDIAVLQVKRHKFFLWFNMAMATIIAVGIGLLFLGYREREFTIGNMFGNLILFAIVLYVFTSKYYKEYWALRKSVRYMEQKGRAY